MYFFCYIFDNRRNGKIAQMVIVLAALTSRRLAPGIYCGMIKTQSFVDSRAGLVTSRSLVSTPVRKASHLTHYHICYSHRGHSGPSRVDGPACVRINYRRVRSRRTTDRVI